MVCFEDLPIRTTIVSPSMTRTTVATLSLAACGARSGFAPGSDCPMEPIDLVANSWNWALVAGDENAENSAATTRKRMAMRVTNLIMHQECVSSATTHARACIPHAGTLGT